MQSGLDMTTAKSKLLIAGGGHADIPMIRAAQQLGFTVITSGNNPNDLGHQESDLYCPGDFSDPEAVLQIATENDIDAICACCNDFSALSVAYAAEQLGLPGHDSLETSLLIHHKDRWRGFANEHGIPSPTAYGCTDLEGAKKAIERLGFPLIVKPVDLTGGKGIRRVDDIETALDATRAAFAVSKAKRVVIEEFIEGSRHGFTAMLRGHKVVFSFVDDEHYHISPYLVSGATAPSNCSANAETKLIKYSEKIANTLNLCDGIFHVQFIENEFGRPIIIEICRRAPGDLYVELVRYCTGAPYAKWIVRAAAGMGIPDVQPLPVVRRVTRQCLMADSEGVFEGFNFDHDIKGSVIDRMIWAKKGDLILDPATHKLGIIFIEHASEALQTQRVSRIQDMLSAVVSKQ